MVRRHGKRGKRKERPRYAIRRELPQDQAVPAERREKRSGRILIGLIAEIPEKKTMDNKALETSTPLSQQTGRRLYGAALGFVMTALMLTVLLEALDQTVVGTALPKIIGTLQGFDRYTWAVTAY